MRASLLLVVVLSMAPSSSFAQCFKIAEVNAETPEGQLLQQIGQESDDVKKLALLEKFAAEHAKHEAVGWVYEQAQAAYSKAGNPDKVLELGGKILALSPDCVESAQQMLKAAEAKKDLDLIRKWSDQTSQIALKVANAPKPADEDQVEAWKNRADWARQVNTYTEYSLYAAALQAPEPKKKIELLEALQARNAKSEYLAKAYGQLFLAYRQAGANDKAVALAQKVLATDESDPDMLIVLASDYLAKKKEPEKVHAYSAKVVQIMTAQPKPEGVSDADWQKRRNAMLGAAHFVSGSLYYAQARWPQADKELREAVPLLDNEQVKAEALYYLGFANYKMEKGQEAANFYRQCSTIKSRFQALAAKNLAGVRREFTGIK
ncbi:MAG TPA: hypothetical protein VN442_22610 [Bryobacteraceae bacterium]|nr:hypothetical protein [Bryobacteraceae bacterium]